MGKHSRRAQNPAVVQAGRAIGKNDRLRRAFHAVFLHAGPEGVVRGIERRRDRELEPIDAVTEDHISLVPPNVELLCIRGTAIDFRFLVNQVFDQLHPPAILAHVPRGIRVMLVGVGQGRGADLPQVFQAGCLMCPPPRCAEAGHQNGHQHHDDRNNHDQFNKREGSALGLHWHISLVLRALGGPAALRRGAGRSIHTDHHTL